MDKALASLRLARVIDGGGGGGAPRWVGGDAVVVQLGDVLDRGDVELGARLAGLIAGPGLLALDCWPLPAVLWRPAFVAGPGLLGLARRPLAPGGRGPAFCWVCMACSCPPFVGARWAAAAPLALARRSPPPLPIALKRPTPCATLTGILKLLIDLDLQAQKQGGAVYMLNGNHESLNVCGDFRWAG